MNNNANERFKSFDLNQTKYFRTKWKNQDDFFDDYNHKSLAEKRAFHAQLKALFVINYRKQFWYKIVFSFKNYLFWFNLLFLIGHIILIIFAITASIIIKVYSDKNSLHQYIYGIIFFSLIFIIFYSIGSFFSFILNGRKLDKKAFYDVYGKGLKNYQFNFSNQVEIFDFIKSKKHPETIKFNGSQQDFHYFSILYSREVDNDIIDITTNNLLGFNGRHKGYGMGALCMPSILTPIFRFRNLEMFKEKEFAEKEKDYYTNKKYEKVARERNLIYPIRGSQKTKKRFKVLPGTFFCFFIIFLFQYSLSIMMIYLAFV